jgi:hypothetical protein
VRALIHRFGKEIEMDMEMKARRLEQTVNELAVLVGIAGAAIAWDADSGWDWALAGFLVVCALSAWRGGRITP